MTNKKQSGTGLDKFHESAPFPTNPAERQQQVKPTAPSPPPSPPQKDRKP